MSVHDVPLLELRSLTWDYGGPPVLAGASLLVAPGEIVAVTGPSGSGKSTLLALAGLLRRPPPGQVFHWGTDAGAAPETWVAARRRRLRFVFQRPYLLRPLTVVENIETGALSGSEADAPLRARAEELLTGLGLEGLGSRWPEELSGGQQQRAALARALIGKPDLLLADEPTASLDYPAARIVADRLHDLASSLGCGVIMTTHDPRITDIATRRLEVVGGALRPG
ncbi:MAG TPA: ATP-binding cassette domain-containing protein [Microvirga sp.]|nr:ATP-binding cassette domain-containing protein [Microvirga sp.]